jgi:hypothetical protein
MTWFERGGVDVSERRRNKLIKTTPNKIKTPNE